MDVPKSFRFDRWANGVLLNTIPETCAPAVRFIAHVIAAEHVWLARMNKEPQPCPVWPAWNLAETRDWYERLPSLLANWVDDSNLLAERVAYTNTQNESFENTGADILHHLVFHGVHHRAQVLMELRAVGITPPLLDYIHAVRHNLIA